MGFIKCQINGKEKIIKTVEITNLIPCDWGISEYLPYKGGKVHLRKEQEYKIGNNRPSLRAGDSVEKINYGSSKADYGQSIPWGDMPNLTYNDLSNFNFKFNIKNGTNLIELIEDYNIGSSTRVMLDKNNYFDINVVDGSFLPHYPDRLGFSITGNSNGINIYMDTSGSYLTTITNKDITSGQKFFNPIICLIENNNEIIGVMWGTQYSDSPTSVIGDVYVGFTDSPNFRTFFSVAKIYNDSNELGGTSTENTFGNGDFDRTSDEIEAPALPTLTATECGFVTLYSPGLNTLIQFCNYLWSDNLWIAVQKWFADPSQIMVGLGIVPVQVETNGTFYHKVGTVEFPVPMPLVKSQYQEFDCGSLEVKHFWGSALDYAPYTQIQIYLPYIGVRELNTDEIMGKTVSVKYHIDLYGGGVVAFVLVNNSVRYQYSGNCMQQIPISSANYSELIANLVQLACVVGTGIAAAGAGAAAYANEAASESIGTAAVESSDDFGAGLANWIDNGGAGKLLNCTVQTIMSNKPRIERTGSLGAVTGQMAIQKPFLIITRPEQSLPENYKHYNGYPSNITSRLGDLSGFTQVENIRLNDIPATQPEIIEIHDLLQKGVII